MTESIVCRYCGLHDKNLPIYRHWIHDFDSMGKTGRFCELVLAVPIAFVAMMFLRAFVIFDYWTSPDRYKS